LFLKTHIFGKEEKQNAFRIFYLIMSRAGSNDVIPKSCNCATMQY